MIDIPAWKSLIFGENGTSAYQEKYFRQKLISELSKTDADGFFTNSFSSNNDLLRNTFTFLISSIFEKNHDLVVKRDAAIRSVDTTNKLVEKNKKEYEVELDKKKEAVHVLEYKLSKFKSIIKSNIQTI